MTWDQAKNLISDKLIISTTFDPNSNTRRIIETPSSHKCSTYNYYPEYGFKVKIGKNINDTLEIPWSMLKNEFEDSMLNDKIYNKDVFIKRYLHQANDDGCHIHVVGRMFLYARVAKQINFSNYIILV